MIDFLQFVVRSLIIWFITFTIGDFLWACAKHEAWEWINRNPDRADRVALRLQRWVDQSRDS